MPPLLGAVGVGCCLGWRSFWCRTARVSGAGGVGWAVILRTLRTAQWTRASSNIFLPSMYLDIRAGPRRRPPLSGVGVWWMGVGVCVVKLLRAHGGCLGT